MENELGQMLQTTWNINMQKEMLHKRSDGYDCIAFDGKFVAFSQLLTLVLFTLPYKLKWKNAYDRFSLVHLLQHGNFTKSHSSNQRQPQKSMLNEGYLRVMR